MQWRAFSSIHYAKDSFQRTLETIQRQHIQRVLLNLDGMPELSALDAYLLETNYLLALPMLPLQQVALVLTSYMQHQMLLESTLQQPSFDIQVFDDAATALEWIRQPTALAVAKMNTTPTLYQQTSRKQLY
ncbi:hypothetical protein DNI29_14915 [Hymenobacter sediminis]|uniref:hypothetical protein n=1 Tax=Hymenobacter sediminis TaxID=2218621 RepID=UPI000DA649E6|nr:hypothetical protein [Hymenobacter sediminis]RPD46291.1 hypothetical protein DNI29_14915 [Hymenobacter sediminis]